MKAFHNDPKVKSKYLKRIRSHAEADEIVKGQYWERGHGCAVGCTIHGSDHRKYETELGIPEWLARLEDAIFEGLPNKRAMLWPEHFLSAVKPGADLDKIKGPFLIFVLESVLEKFDHKKSPDVKKSIDLSIALWSRADIGSKEWEKSAARAAEAARAAAWAERAAAEAAWAAKAAAEAAKAAAWAARAAKAAADAAARAAAEYEKFADKLLELIRGCE